MKKILLLLFLNISFSAHAAARMATSSSLLDSDLGSLSVEGLLGYSEINMQNVSGGQVYYHGPTLRANVVWSLLKGEVYGIFLVGNMKYSQVKNDGNSSFQKEDGQFYGYGGGLAFRYGRFILGGDYNFMNAAHDASGFISNNLKYNFKTTSYYLSYLFSEATSSFGVSLQGENGQISKEALGLSKGSNFKSLTGFVFMNYGF